MEAAIPSPVGLGVFSPYAMIMVLLRDCVSPREGALRVLWQSISTMLAGHKGWLTYGLWGCRVGKPGLYHDVTNGYGRPTVEVLDRSSKGRDSDDVVGDH